MKKMSIKTVVAVGIGAALFFVLARFVSIPSGIPNTSICLQYAVLALFAILYGPVAGGLIGFIGQFLGYYIAEKKNIDADSPRHLTQAIVLDDK